MLEVIANGINDDNLAEICFGLARGMCDQFARFFTGYNALRLRVLAQLI
jgi:hypothetical protein